MNRESFAVQQEIAQAPPYTPRANLPPDEHEAAFEALRARMTNTPVAADELRVGPKGRRGPTTKTTAAEIARQVPAGLALAGVSLASTPLAILHTLAIPEPEQGPAGTISAAARLLLGTPSVRRAEGLLTGEMEQLNEFYGAPRTMPGWLTRQAAALAGTSALIAPIVRIAGSAAGEAANLRPMSPKGLPVLNFDVLPVEQTGAAPGSAAAAKLLGEPVFTPSKSMMLRVPGTDYNMGINELGTVPSPVDKYGIPLRITRNVREGDAAEDLYYFNWLRRTGGEEPPGPPIDLSFEDVPDLRGFTPAKYENFAHPVHDLYDDIQRLRQVGRTDPVSRLIHAAENNAEVERRLLGLSADLPPITPSAKPFVQSEIVEAFLRGQPEYTGPVSNEYIPSIARRLPRGQAGFQVVSSLAGTGTGATEGAGVGSTPKERRRNAILGGIAGGLVGLLLGRRLASTPIRPPTGTTSAEVRRSIEELFASKPQPFLTHAASKEPTWWR